MGGIFQFSEFDGLNRIHWEEPLKGNIDQMFADPVNLTLREKCSNAEFFLVRIFLHSG